MGSFVSLICFFFFSIAPAPFLLTFSCSSGSLYDRVSMCFCFIVLFFGSKGVEGEFGGQPRTSGIKPHRIHLRGDSGLAHRMVMCVVSDFM